MPQTLKIANYNTNNILEKTKLSADASVGTSFTIENANNFSATNYFIVGNLASESSEILTVLSVAGSAITSTVTSVRSHTAGEQITRLFGNQIRVYRATNVNGTLPTDGSFTFLSAVSIDVDQAQTDYTDPSGASTYWYKYTYYNATSSEETNLADSSGVRGGGYGNYASIESIRREAGLLNNRWISDAQVDEKRQAAQMEINSSLSGSYTVPFTSPINPLIAEITRKLAAGFLLISDYGSQASPSTNDGDYKVKEARALLAKINSRELKLIDAIGTDTSLTSSTGYSGYPNSTTADALPENGGGARSFRVSDRY